MSDTPTEPDDDTADWPDPAEDDATLDSEGMGDG
jgi:hypothetical protein